MISTANPESTLSALLSDPTTEVRPEEVPALLVRLAQLQALVLGKFLVSEKPAAEPKAPEADRFLTTGEVAALLGVTPKWVYAHACQLPFTRKLGHRTLRFSEAGLRNWQDKKSAKGALNLAQSGK